MRLFSLALLGLTACSTVISPAELQAIPEENQGIRAIENWKQSISLVNEFLEAQAPAELPWFRLGWSDRHGMFLVREDGVQSFRVACTPWGWLVVKSGFTAQERSWGFVVGPTADGEQPQLDNTFFQGLFGMRGPQSLGGLILHEAIHTVQPSGTVGFFRGLRYYWWAIWKGGGEAHPDEALAYAVERRFRDWAAERARIEDR